MEINQLYDFITTTEFKSPDTGNLFFPAYMFTYKPDEEYNIRKQIQNIKQRLERPKNFIDSMIFNIYEELIDFLKMQEIMGDNLLHLVFEKEEEEAQAEVIKYLKSKANSTEFYQYIEKKVDNYKPANANLKLVFLLIYGFGTIYPFLRASVFLNSFHKYLERRDLKVIIFYPGSYKEGNYWLFDKINDKHLYRATWLNEFGV
jgi:hypothetical protein